MPRFPSAQGRLNHEPDSTLAVTKTCPKDGVHLFFCNDVFDLASEVATDLAYFDPPYGSNNEKMPPGDVPAAAEIMT